MGRFIITLLPHLGLMMTEVIDQGAALIVASENFLFYCNCSLITIENNVLTLTLLVLNFY